VNRASVFPGMSASCAVMGDFFSVSLDKKNHVGIHC